MALLVGGVSHLYQGDLDLGRVAVERLSRESLGEDVLVEDLSYGAVAVSQRLRELRPDGLILVSATDRGGRPGSVRLRRMRVEPPDPEVVQEAVAEAVTGYLGTDLVLLVCAGFGVFPDPTVLVEVQPARVEPGSGLSREAAAGLGEALRVTRQEVRRLRRRPVG